MDLNKCLTGPMSCLITMFLLLYILSPIDGLPELFLGPIGLIDDLLAFGGLFVINSKNILEKGKGLFK